MNETNIYDLSSKLPTDSIAIKFQKYILGVNRRACNEAVRGELGQFPVLIGLVKPLLKYWFRLLQLDTNSFAYKSFMECKNLMVNNKPCWLNGVKHILDSTGKSHISIHDAVDRNLINKSRFVEETENHIQHLYSQQWGSSLQKNDKLRTY